MFKDSNKRHYCRATIFVNFKLHLFRWLILQLWSSRDRTHNIKMCVCSPYGEFGIWHAQTPLYCLENRFSPKIVKIVKTINHKLEWAFINVYCPKSIYILGYCWIELRKISKNDLRPVLHVSHLPTFHGGISAKCNTSV